MLKNWNREPRNCKQRLKQIQAALIGIMIFTAMLLLCGCATRVCPAPIEPEPINCIRHIKTPADMAACLSEYDLKYNSLRNTAGG